MKGKISISLPSVLPIINEKDSKQDSRSIFFSLNKRIYMDMELIDSSDTIVITKNNKNFTTSWRKIINTDYSQLDDTFKVILSAIKKIEKLNYNNYGFKININSEIPEVFKNLMGEEVLLLLLTTYSLNYIFDTNLSTEFILNQSCFVLNKINYTKELHRYVPSSFLGGITSAMSEFYSYIKFPNPEMYCNIGLCKIKNTNINDLILNYRNTNIYELFMHLSPFNPKEVGMVFKKNNLFMSDFFCSNKPLQNMAMHFESNKDIYGYTILNEKDEFFLITISDKEIFSGLYDIVNFKLSQDGIL